MSDDHGTIASGIGTRHVTPLVIILAFILLVEVTTVYGVTTTAAFPQILLSWFSVLFPTLISVWFFSLLTFRAWVFYAPKDFGDTTDPAVFISLLRNITQNSVSVFDTLPAKIEAATQRAGNANGKGDSSSRGPDLQELGRRVAEEVRQSTTIVVELDEFRGGTVGVPVSDALTVGNFLDIIYFEIRETTKIAPYTYGSRWVLEDDKGNRYPNAGRDWARERGLKEDSRSLAELGMRPGMHLRALRL